MLQGPSEKKTKRITVNTQHIKLPVRLLHVTVHDRFLKRDKTQDSRLKSKGEIIDEIILIIISRGHAIIIANASV